MPYTNTIPRRFDVAVVGARSAGASTAMLLARMGFRVLVVDRGQYGSDTLSTHALMRGGVQQLHHWGLLTRLKDAGTPPIRMTSFHYGDEVQEVQIKPRDGVDALYAPRRTVLDALLVDAAREAGAQVEYGVRVVDLLRAPDNRINGIVVKSPGGRVVRINADTVIGADGVRSTIARLVDSKPYRLGRHASGTIFAYWSGLEVSGYHWYYRPGVSAGVIPTNDGLSCVFVSLNSQGFREEIAHDIPSGYQRLLGQSDPDLARVVSQAERIGNFRGFPGAVGFLRQSWGPGWALVGDAGYFRDPITAHGITDAFRDADVLSRALAAGTPEALANYEFLRNNLSMGLFEASDQIASFGWDLPKVQERHLFMSKEMGREVRFLKKLHTQQAGIRQEAYQTMTYTSDLVA
jgi:2-polyprenyl-6-methoxyphenol hydroxylase-like FAD-dependent oxidoreductase